MAEAALALDPNKYYTDEDLGIGSSTAKSSSSPSPIQLDPNKYYTDADLGIGAPSTPTTGPLSNTGDEGFWSGLGKGAATAAIKGVANIPGAPGNLAHLTDYLLSRAESAITGKPVDKVMQEHQQKRDLLAKGMSDLGLPNISPFNMPTGDQIAAPILEHTGQYTPESEPGKIAQTGLETAISALGPGSGGAVRGVGAVKPILSTLKMAPANIAAGATGQAATDFTGDPLYGMAAGLATAPVAELGAAGARSALRPALPQIPLVNKLPGVSSIPQRMAGEELQRAAQDTNAVRVGLGLDPTQDTSRQAMLEGPVKGPQQPPPPAAPTSTPIVPGSKPTTGQLTGDMGLLQKERQARTEDVTPFNIRESDQNTARRSALASAAPENADTLRPSQLFSNQLDAIDKATQTAVDHATTTAQAHATTLGPAPNPEDTGATLRSAIEGVRSDAKAIRNKLFDAVDPNNDLALVATPVRQAAERLGNVDQFGTPLQGDEARIFAKAQSLPDVIPFKSLRAFEQNVTQAMARERAAAGETPVWGRLSQLKGATLDAINNAIDNQAAHEQRAVASGTLQPEDTMASRLADVFPGDRPLTVPGGATTAVQRTKPLPAAAVPTRATAPRELSLFEHLASNGGLRPDSELRAIIGGNPFIPGSGRLIRRGGMSLDEARAAATAEGYLHDAGAMSGAGPLRTDINSLLDLLGKEARGEKQYRLGAEPPSRQNYAKDKQAVEDDLRTGLRETGVDPRKIDRSIIDSAVDKVLTGQEHDPLHAYERAVMEDNGQRDSETERRLHETVPNDTGGAPEGSHAFAGTEAGAPGRSGQNREAGAASGYGGNNDREGGGARDSQPPLTPNFDQAAAGRLAGAKAAHQDYARTFKEGPVAPTLATGGFKDNYKLPASAVPGRAIVKGDRGYQTVKAFLKAADNSPDAIAALQDHALNPLRSSLLPIGTISPSKFAHWKQDYAGSLRALDEASPGFSDRFSTAAKATDAMMDAGKQRQAQLEAFQKSAAGEFLGKRGKSDPAEVENYMGTLMAAKDGPTRMKALVKEAAADPQAVEGLRKAGVDWMLRKFSTTAEAGTSGEKLLSAGAFRKFVVDNRNTLRELYGQDGVLNFTAIAADLERANRSVTATRIAGSPGTAHDLQAGLKKATEAVQHHTSIVTAILGGGFLGLQHGGTMYHAAQGAAGGAAAYLLGTLRSAGMNNVNALVRDALLNPERARLYLSKIDDAGASNKLFGLSRSIRRQLINAPIQQQNAAPPPPAPTWSAAPSGSMAAVLQQVAR